MVNREIKFRVWESPFMYYLSTPEIMDNGLWFDIEKTNDIDNHINGWDEMILMQYTGLKDKNGREIYEGDILDDLTGMFDGVVDFNHICFGIFEGSVHPEHIEIIGNIYENPELLKR